MGDELFEGPTTIGQFLDERRGKALADIAALPSDLVGSHHPDDLQAELVERWRVNELALDWPAMTSEVSEVGIPDGVQPGELTGTEVTLFVPFSGAPGLFHMRPSTYPENPPHGTVRGGETLLLNHSYIDADLATVKRELDHQVAAVKECVSSINSDVDVFNADLSGLIRRSLKTRLEKLQADADVVAALGIPPRPHHEGGSGGIGASTSGRADSNRRADAQRYRTSGWRDIPEPQGLGQKTPRRPGRPKGPDLVQTAAEIVTAYQKRWSSDGPRPDWSEVARELGVDERTLRNARRHFSIDEGAIDRPSE